MMARQRDEISIFSTSFLDLLSCGMGAVIILLIIFLSRIEIKSHDATSFALVTIAVEYAEPDRVGPPLEHLFVGGKEVVRPSPTGGLQQIDASGQPHPVSATQSFSGACGPVPSGADCVVSTSAYQSPTSSANTLTYHLHPPGSVPTVVTGTVSITMRRTYTVLLKDIQSDERIRLTIQRRQFPSSSGGDKPLAYQKLDRAVCAFEYSMPVGQAEIPPCPFPTSDQWLTALLADGNIAANYPVRITCQVHSSAEPVSPGAASKQRLVHDIVNDDTLVQLDKISLDVLVDADLLLENPLTLH